MRNRLLRAMLQWTTDKMLLFLLAADCVLPTACRLGPYGQPPRAPMWATPTVNNVFTSFSGAIARPNQLSERHRASKKCWQEAVRYRATDGANKAHPPQLHTRRFAKAAGPRGTGAWYVVQVGKSDLAAG